jgi:hypothetical protein
VQKKTAPLSAARVQKARTVSTYGSSSDGITVPVPAGAPKIPDEFRAQHKQIRQDRSGRRQCNLCAKTVRYVCHQCGHFYCFDEKEAKMTNNQWKQLGAKEPRKCFYSHICEMFKTSGQASSEWIAAFDTWDMHRRRA